MLKKAALIAASLLVVAVTAVPCFAQNEIAARIQQLEIERTYLKSHMEELDVRIHSYQEVYQKAMKIHERALTEKDGAKADRNVDLKEFNEYIVRASAAKAAVTAARMKLQQTAGEYSDDEAQLARVERALARLAIEQGTEEIKQALGEK